MRNRRPTLRRLGVAVCVAPLTTVIVNFTLCWISNFKDPEPISLRLQECFDASLLMSLFTVPIAFISILFGGIPVHLFLLERECYGPLGYVLAALVMVAIIQLISLPLESFPANFVGLFAPHAIAVSWVAWYIAAKD